jgi:hypothetical protein
MPKDVTAIVVPLAQLGEDDARAAVAARGLGDVLVRVVPLVSVGLLQIEVHQAHDDLPCEDPELVMRLASGGRGAFVHVNHSARQAIVHAFDSGRADPGFIGEPGADFDARLQKALGVTLDALTNADDGTRLGFGVAASRTQALVRGRTLAVPPGTPTNLGSFRFHDRGAELDDERERLAVLAFDGAAARRRWAETPGRALADALAAAPAHAFGPLAGARDEAVAALRALGDRMPAGALDDVRAFELVALDEARAFAGGDAVAYWDERVLPLLALASEAPVVSASDLEDLDDCASVLHALVEVLPFAPLPGGESVLTSIGAAELGPLAPWARAGDDYAGTLFAVRGERLLDRARALEGARLASLVENLERAWYRAARPGQPEGDAFEAFRRAHADEGATDVDRCLRTLTELRVVLELAAANRYELALLFYEGA